MSEADEQGTRAIAGPHGAGLAEKFFDNACQFVVATREPFVFLTETSNCDHSCETTRNVKKLEVLVLGCNPARPSPGTWRALLAFRQRQVPPGNAR